MQIDQFRSAGILPTSETIALQMQNWDAPNRIDFVPENKFPVQRLSPLKQT